MNDEKPLPPVVFITWVDACSDPGYDGPAETAGGLAILHRVAFHVRTTKDSYVFASEIHTDNKSVREPITIPKKWVTSMIPLVPGEKKRGTRTRR